MRQHHYNFAHRVLPRDTREPSLWGVISSEQAATYLKVRWDSAASDIPEPAKGLIWVAPVTIDGIEIRLIRMPTPSAMGETHYAALAKSPSGAVRYFVAEQGDNRVYMAEWVNSTRVRYDNLAENADAATLARLGALSSDSAPWEVASSSIPGMAYCASFIVAVAQEMTNEVANAQSLPAEAVEPPEVKTGISNTTMIVGSIVAIILFVILRQLFAN
jgi:hypothetical protein